MQVDARALALTLVRATSRSSVAEGLVGGLAQSRSVVLARVWLLDATGGALTLAGSAGTPSGGGSYRRLDGEFRQFAVRDARILDIASTRQPVILRGIRGDEDWLSASWASRQGVRAFVALPLVAGELVAGVIAVFDRQLPDDRALADLQFVTDVAAARIAELGARETTPPSPPETAVPAGRDGGPLEGLRPPRGMPASPKVAFEHRARESGAVVTRAELRRIETENIEAALRHTGGKVFGPDGAAMLLGMRPTTLASRIKALGIPRPAPESQLPHVKYLTNPLDDG